MHRRQGRELAGRRNAEQVLAVLTEAARPLTAYELLDRLSSSGITAATTVYRALARLISAGHVHRLNSLNAYIACDNNYHTEQSAVVFVVCRVCHATAEIAVPSVTKVLDERLGDHGFSIVAANIEINGLCADCAKRRPEG
ncbi:MAG: transcriptional repressor [Pseudolabrys sp.]